MVINKVSWEASDLPCSSNTNRTCARAALPRPTRFNGWLTISRLGTWFKWAKVGLWSHALFWSCLILLYPKFPQVQAFFFWNPWVRGILGMGYVGFLLTHVPPLRSSIPSFLHHAEGLGERVVLKQQLTETFHQWAKTFFQHGRDEIVEHAALAK